jgi:hypothetical protein
VLEHTAHNGNTFGTVLCGWGNTTEVIDFLEYVSKLDVEMRIKILSHRTSKRRNIYNMLQEHQNAPRVFAAFHACLGGMSEDQQALCSGEGYSPVHGLNKSD